MRFSGAPLVPASIAPDRRGLSGTNALAYMNSLVSDKHEKVYNVDTRGQCYKAFFFRNLRIFIISWSVCPCQAFPAKSNVCG
jgi:hypothetical protein